MKGNNNTGGALLESASFNIDPQTVDIRYKYANSWDNLGNPNGYTDEVTIAGAVGHSHTDDSVASQCAQDNPFKIQLSQHEFSKAVIIFPGAISSIDGNDVSAQTPTVEFSLADLVAANGNVDENWRESDSGDGLTRFKPNKILPLDIKMVIVVYISPLFNMLKSKR